MAVHLTRIYTRTGDDGTTGLADFSRVSKTDPRLVAYADCDETNATLGLVMALGLRPRTWRPSSGACRTSCSTWAPIWLRRSSPDPPYPPLRVTQDYIDRLEVDCDRFNADLTELTSFILPGGTPAAALLHQARTVARRAERSAWALRQGSGPQQPAGGDLPQPAVGPAVHPGAGGEPGRGRDVGPGGDRSRR